MSAIVQPNPLSNTPTSIGGAPATHRPHASLQRIWTLIGVRWTLLLALLTAATLYFLKLSPWQIGGAFAGVVLVGLVVARRSATARFASQSWSFDEHLLTVTRGARAVATISIPRNRIHYAETSAGPLERRVGLMHVRVYVAGSDKPAVTIPGLTPQQAEWLRRELVGLGPPDA